MFGQRDKCIGSVKRTYRAAFDVVDPSMECQATLSKSQGYRRMCAQIVQLSNDILANHAVYPVVFVRMILRLINHPSGICIVQPVLYRRHVIQARARGDGFHCTAIRVTADHDISYFQLRYCIFNCCADTAWFGAERRHDVSCITNDEQLAGFSLRHKFRHHAAVRARNE